MDNCPCRKYSGYLHRLLGTFMRSILLKILYSKFRFSSDTCICYDSILAISSILIARFMGPTWGPSGADRTQVGPMLAPWTLLSGTTKCLHVQLVMQLLNVQKFAIITCFNLDMRKITHGFSITTEKSPVKWVWDLNPLATCLEKYWNFNGIYGITSKWIFFTCYVRFRRKVYLHSTGIYA